MSSIKFTSVFLIYFFGITTLLNAQDKYVYGIIHAFDSIPLVNAEIYIKGTKETVFTDNRGKFLAPVNKKDKLKITARGFVTKKVKIDEKIKGVFVNMEHKANTSRNELYDVGYLYMPEKNRSTATNNLAKNEASFSRYSTIQDMIIGQFPGVEVKNGEIVIRGSNTFNSSNSALIVLDGVIVEQDFLRTLRPVQVKDINVIKDGSAAVFGSRGAGGVVLIETIKGGDTLK